MHIKSAMGVAAMAIALLFVSPEKAGAQYDSAAPESRDTLVLSLDDALRIALSENISVKVADMEVERTEYARRGSYSSLLPQINGSGSFQRTIRKQVMYMGGSSSDDEEGGGGGMSSMFSGILDPVMYYITELMKQHPGAIAPYVPSEPSETESGSDSGFEVGRLNTFNAGISAQMPLVNFQLWESIRLAGQQAELAVEQARQSRLAMVTRVKQAYYGVLLAKETFAVYKEVYDNAVENFRQTERKYKVDKASELEYTRAMSTVAAAVPNVYNAESSIILALWQLKAVMGIDLDMNIDVQGGISDYADAMLYDITEGENATLENNSSLRQLALQAEQIATSIRMQKYAYLPSLSLGFAYSYNAMTDDFKFKDYHWTPYSYIGLSLSIPIFSGGQRYYAVKQANVQAAELDYQRINAERQLRIAIRQSLNSMETAMRTYEAAGEALQSAEKAYSIAVKSYNVGRSTLTDLNDAQLILTQTRLQATQAIYSFLVAKSALEETLGYDFTLPEE